MATFWTMTGFIPLILYGIALYLLFWRLPRWIRSRSARAPKEPVTVPIQTRKRSSGSISQVAEPAAQISAVALASAASRPSAQEAHQAAVSETMSVVLRRQIPPRLDQPSRSWIGGLPQMPDEMEWPRSISSESPQQGERPLHFLAQVCCADLPQELWGGLGPRDGWLLLFIDPNQGCPEGPDAFKVLHIDALGPEREPPFDLGPVYDGVYTGPDYRYLLPDEPVPNKWRRWPVDLIVVPNEAREEQGRTLVTPENFAPILYDGAEVRSGHSLPAPPRPLTVGHARYALAAVRRNLDRAVPPIKISEQFTDELKKSGAIAALLRNCAAEQAAIRGSSGP